MDVDVTLVDRRNHLLFQPLLYQVATGMLSPGQIAMPLRHILRRADNTRVLLAEVTGFDLDDRVVHARAPGGIDLLELPYDSLIVAAGAGQSYFGHDELARHAPGMKTIDDALELRRRFFGAFEMAELTTDQSPAATLADRGDRRHAGPTGVELAGQVRELATRSLRNEFRSIDPSSVRCVIVVDGGGEPLATFGGRLSHAARKELDALGVELQMHSRVVGVDQDGVDVLGADGVESRIEAHTTVWAAGVQASPLAQLLADRSGATLDRAGRIGVADDLSLADHPEVFAIGDMATYQHLPGVAEVAMQGGSCTRQHDRSTARRQTSCGVQVSGLRHRRDGRSIPGDREYSRAAPERSCGMVRLVLRPSRVPERLRQPVGHHAALDAFDDRPRPADRVSSTAHVGGDLSLPPRVRAIVQPTPFPNSPPTSGRQNET